MKAIRISKNHLDTIAAETGIKKESMELLALQSDTFLVTGPEIIHGWQTYQWSIFFDQFEYVGNHDPRVFSEVKFK